jgi:hypothetical protein
MTGQRRTFSSCLRIVASTLTNSDLISITTAMRSDSRTAQNVDRAALAVLRVGVLDEDGPTVAPQEGCDRLDDFGVVFVEQAVDVSGSPSHAPIEGGLEGSERASDQADGQG